jgi:hypothetical protein|nr:MAG TPA: hypothetical protein [Caudoviricetes sp.]DAZ00464.1 MAG TPA: hypothetical protein [Caudoviricetes sp.]
MHEAVLHGTATIAERAENAIKPSYATYAVVNVTIIITVLTATIIALTA